MLEPYPDQPTPTKRRKSGLRSRILLVESILLSLGILIILVLDLGLSQIASDLMYSIMIFILISAIPIGLSQLWIGVAAALMGEVRGIRGYLIGSAMYLAVFLLVVTDQLSLASDFIVYLFILVPVLLSWTITLLIRNATGRFSKPVHDDILDA